MANFLKKIKENRWRIKYILLAVLVIAILIASLVLTLMFVTSNKVKIGLIIYEVLMLSICLGLPLTMLMDYIKEKKEEK